MCENMATLRNLSKCHFALTPISFPLFIVEREDFNRVAYAFQPCGFQFPCVNVARNFLSCGSTENDIRPGYFIEFLKT